MDEWKNETNTYNRNSGWVNGWTNDYNVIRNAALVSECIDQRNVYNYNTILGSGWIKELNKFL